MTLSKVRDAAPAAGDVWRCLDGADPSVLERLYEIWRADAAAVAEEWRTLFAALDRAPAPAQTPPATLSGGGVPQDHGRAVQDTARALMLLNAYRLRGHLLADLDPLKLEPRPPRRELEPDYYGFAQGDMERPVFVDGAFGVSNLPLGRFVELLRRTYCGTMAVEYMHIQQREQRLWLQERLERTEPPPPLATACRRRILELLISADAFEGFLQRKYPGGKRFGLEGAESFIVALDALLWRGAELKVREVMLGMAHRGRLSVLAHILCQPPQAVFSMFRDEQIAHAPQHSGDVRYHLGTSAMRQREGLNLYVSLAANPSHLESVNTVVLGKARAKQLRYARKGREHAHHAVMAVLAHGDAAYAGQGIVAETHGLSALEGYRVGGTVHVIVNNQIGFTTSPRLGRSSPYCSDRAKAVQAPVFHVNGDHPEDVARAARLAVAFRHAFATDVVIDLVCYRRYGHSEIDDPSFTQPRMYRRIADMEPVARCYGRRLAADGVLQQAEAEALRRRLNDDYEKAHAASSSWRPQQGDWLRGAWSGLKPARGDAVSGETAVSLHKLRRLAEKVFSWPHGFAAHPKVQAAFARRRRAMESGAGVDWASAETLAFASLLSEGTPVRLGGQDSGRGAFSQRHAILVDQQSGARFVPLHQVAADPDKTPCEIVDSPLMEAGTLGFEYGYTLAEPHALVVWEAQFGDFANGAQVMFDQFIASAEAKWLRMSGLVVFLPHGFEGQGPDHSSARVERYLQLAAGDNMQIVNCTTPANLFHVLRRQVRRDFRKPLIVFTPKSLLRHKLCVSALADFAPGTAFNEILDDPLRLKAEQAEKVRRVILCSGKLFYDLHGAREALGAGDGGKDAAAIALVRVESLYPFPRAPLARALARYPRATFLWCQEEPRNMGAWHYMASRLRAMVREERLGDAEGRGVDCVARPESPATAVGSLARHRDEQRALVARALDVHGVHGVHGARGANERRAAVGG